MALTSTDSWHGGEFTLLSFWKQPFYLFFSSEHLCSNCLKNHITGSCKDMLGKKKSGRKLGRKRDTENLKQKLRQPESLVGWNVQDFLPVTPGGPGFHPSSVVLQWEKRFSPLIWHVWEGDPGSIHARALWSTPVEAGGGQTGASPVEDTIGHEAGAQGVWGVSTGDGCAQLAQEKALGCPQRRVAIGWEAKVKSWNTGHSD